MERELTTAEKTILKTVGEKYGENKRDKLFFIQDNNSLHESKLSAMIQVWGDQGNGPWVNLTNVASFLDDQLMTIDEIKNTQV
ncbi:MAG: hypothetical protein ABIS01_00095 [Ferruginibacter sp.]